MVTKLITRNINFQQRESLWVGQFSAMASPCEVLVSCPTKEDAHQIIQIAATEAWRVEQKFSRYRSDGIVPLINTSTKQPVRLDEETAALVDFAFHCYQLSDGMFDISSGILRRAWPFKSQHELPPEPLINELVRDIGLHRINWQAPTIQLPPGMELDFGGIGKEYAVDRALSLVCQNFEFPVLINFGGDIVCNKAPIGQHAWRVAIERPRENAESVYVELKHGGLATSGDTKRFVNINGKRYGHILNPKTGWPIKDAPQTITVAAANCLQAGIFATLAMLNGPQAEEFIKQQEVSYHIFW